MPHVRRKGTLVQNPAENTEETATGDLLLADSPEDDDPLLDEPAPARQGLPPGFRMRHDRHYVEELMGMRAPAPRPVPHVAEHAPAAAPAPPSARETTTETARALRTALAAIAERLDTVREHAVSGRRSGTITAFDRAAEVEIDRASRLAHAAVAIGGDLQLSRREIAAGEIANLAKGAIAPLRRFSGIRFDFVVEDSSFRVAVDSTAVTHALAGTFHAFADLLDGSRDGDELPVVSIRVHAVEPRPALMIEVSATGIAISEDAIGTFFEAAACHVAGTDGAVLLSAGAKVARAHGGRAEARRAGDAIVAVFVFPR